MNKPSASFLQALVYLASIPRRRWSWLPSSPRIRSS